MAMAFATLILSPLSPPQPTPHFSSLQFHGRAPLSRPRLSCPPLHRSRTFPTVGSRQNRRIFSSFDGIKVAASVTREPMIPPYNVLITGSTKGPSSLSPSHSHLLCFCVWIVLAYCGGIMYIISAVFGGPDWICSVRVGFVYPTGVWCHVSTIKED